MVSAVIGAIVGLLLGIGWCMTAVGGGGGRGMLVWPSLAGAIIGLLFFAQISWTKKLVQGKSKRVKRLTTFFTVIVGLAVNVFLLYRLTIFLSLCGFW